MTREDAHAAAQQAANETGLTAYVVRKGERYDTALHLSTWTAAGYTVDSPPILPAADAGAVQNSLDYQAGFRAGLDKGARVPCPVKATWPGSPARVEAWKLGRKAGAAAKKEQGRSETVAA